MAGDRVVKVTLRAVISDYEAGMLKASVRTRELGTEAEKLAQKQDAFNLLGKAALGVGAAAAAGFGIAVAKAAEFDQAMSYVNAATHESAENMTLLREAALEAGARTVFSATESANAIEELGKAGLSTSDILSGGLDGALDLAAAGGLGVADAAGIAATALKTFNLEGSDMGHVADLLAAGAGKAMGDVSDLSAALAQSGMVASATGLSIEETTATLAAFASQGLLGSDAGTSLKSMLQSLTPTSAKARETMDELGISAYDAQGNFIGMEKFAGVLRSGLADLTVEQQQAALKTIFGSDAIRAATVLYQEGAEGIAEWTAAVDDQGYAAETAAMRLDNLSGDVEALGGAIDTALITSGSAANDMFRFLVQSAGDTVDVFNDMPAPIQGVTLAVVGITGAVGLASGAFLLGLPKIAEYKEALVTMGPGAQRAAGVIGTLGKTLGVLAGAFAVASVVDKLTDGFKVAGASAADLTNALVTTSKSTDLISVAFSDVAENWKSAGADEKLQSFGDALEYVDSRADLRWLPLVSTMADDMRDSFGTLGTALGEMANSDLPAAQAKMRSFAEEQKLTDKQLTQMIDLMPDYKDALTEQATAAGKSADEETLRELAVGNANDATEDAVPIAKSAGDAYLETADKAAELADQMLELLTQMNEHNKIGQDSVSATIAYQDALADVDTYIANARAGIEGYSLTLDQNTQTGRDNMSMLNGLAGDYQSAALKQLQLDGNTQAYEANLQSGREAVLQRARDLGATDEQVQFLADHIVNMPTQKEIDIIVDTAGAKADFEFFVSSISQRRIPLIVDAKPGEVGMGNFAYGGYTGSGGKWDVKGIVHADEFVSTKETIAHPTNRAALEFMHNGGVLPAVSALSSQTAAPAAGWNPPTFVQAPPSVISAPASTPGNTFNFKVVATPGMSETQLVDKIMKRVERATR